ncbi:PREDICTED: Retrovirus-related Pol poly from transposon, partial [Prunus dulcis]
VLEVPPMNLHPMQTRSKSGIVKKKVFLTTLQESGGFDLSLVEPATYKTALKVPVWLTAMKEEIDALHSQGTWSLVPLPHNKNLVGCKWIFKIKKHADGSIARHKARLVAKGFSQEPGQDYGETFSPVVKPTTVRIVLALAAHFGWQLRQLDVKNAFLHGILQEEVYMAQPPGFEDSHHPTLVCKLLKSLYGLKQAPRAWNDRFTSFLPTLGFQHTYSDSSLFVKQVDSGIVILLVYVDDIIITGSAVSEIHKVIQSLTVEFEIKDLGDLHYFLGLQISHTNTGLFLSQS